MASIGKIGTTLKENLLYKPVKALGEFKPMQKMKKKYQNGDADFMSAVGVTSIVLRDGVGCYLYVTQSMNNEKIPEDKRKFVAALDLVNGLLMMSMQIGMQMGFSKVQNKFFNKTLGKYFDRNAAKGYKAALGGTQKFKGIGGDEFHPALAQYRKTIVGAFTQVTSLIATTIVAKRMLVPFVSTPLAGKAKEWMSKDDKPTPVNPATVNKYDTEKKLDVTTADVKPQQAKSTEQPKQPEQAKGGNLIDKYVAKAGK